MRKRLIILSMALSVVAGSVAAYAVTQFSNKPDSDKHNYVSYVDDRAPARFVSNPGLPASGFPDFTEAAEQGVKAVVNVETLKKVRVSSAQRGYGNDPYGGQGFDPFEFFFGPQQRQQTPQNEQEFQEQERRAAGGSGVILSSDGYIVTNNHVIEGADKIQVTLYNDERYEATLVGTDPSTDIALLKIEAKNLTAMPFGNSDDLRLGEWVLAIGNPYALNSTVTAGIVSAKGRSLNVLSSNQLGIESFIQTDAVVNPGNSGGALMTTDGKLIGINTVIKSPTGSYAGYSFAVPSTIVSKVVADLKEYGVVQRAMLGITFNEINANWIEDTGKEKGITKVEGVYIHDVVEGGAAHAAGIRGGDVLTHINGKTINKSAEVQEAIAQLRPNDKVNVTIKRDGSVKQFDVTLRNRAGKTELIQKDATDLLKELGATFREITNQQKAELKINGGIQVTSLKSEGLLARARVRSGYIITAINDKPVRSISDLNRITDKVESIDGVYPDGRVVYYQIVPR